MAGHEERSRLDRAVEAIAAGLDLAGVMVGILKSPGVGFTLAILAGGGTLAAVVIRRMRRDEVLTIR